MRIIRTLRRDLGRQFNESRNLREPYRTKLQRAYWAIRFLGKAVKVAVISMRMEQLGSQVTYQGRKCIVNNWSGSQNPTLSGDDGFYQKNVPRNEITSVKNLREYYHRFCFGLEFYMSNWHGIDVNKRVYEKEYRGL